MNYIFEAILVGLYTSFLYLLFSPFVKNLFLLLLVIGFFKHFLGSSFGIHTWYCNNGETCKNVLSQDQTYTANTLYLIRDSIYESFIFLIFGYILSFKLTKLYLFFTVGFILHIISEKLLVHKYFCIKTCNKV